MNNEKTLVRIELTQKGKVISFNTEISDSCKVDQVAGTIAFRVIALFQRAKKFRFNLDGFSFARKFDVKIIIEGREATGTQVILNGSMQFGLTLQNNEKSISTFGEFIGELIEDIMIGSSEMEVSLKDLLDEVGITQN